MSSAPTLDFCMRSVASIVMALQSMGAKQEDIVRALHAAAACELELRVEATKGEREPA